MKRTDFDPAPHPEVAKVWLSWVKWKSQASKSSAWEYSEMIRYTIWGDISGAELATSSTALVILDIVPDSSGNGLWIIREKEHLYFNWNDQYHKFVYLPDPIPIREALVVTNSGVTRNTLDKYLLSQKKIL